MADHQQFTGYYATVNQINLEGKMISEPQVKELDNGNVLVSLKISVIRPRTKIVPREEGYPASDIFNIECWSACAAIARDLCKGDRIAVSGSMQNRRYKPKGEEKERDWWSITARFLCVLPAKAQTDAYGDEPKRNATYGARAPQVAPTQATPASAASTFDDDDPFAGE